MCDKKLVSNWIMLGFAVTLGLLAIIFNSYNLVKSMLKKKTGNIKESVFIQKALVNLIAFGDFLTGSYLLSLSIFELIIGKGFCVRQLEWLTTTYCGTLGVISTTGSLVSSVAMAALSVLRLRGTRQALNYQVGEDVSLKTERNVRVGCGMTIFVAMVVAVTPLIGPLEDSFVNGLLYDPDNRLFIGVVDQTKHSRIIQKYHGAHHNVQGKHFSWSAIRSLVGKMFSDNYKGVQGRKLSFYGNDPVCLFKFFVKSDDPQLGFVWSILTLNLILFCTVIVCHVILTVLATQNSVQLPEAVKRNERLR
eukprot:sb/3467217/